MKIYPIKTNRLISGEKYRLFDLFDRHLPMLKNASVLAITSKIISICQGRVVKIEGENKKDLVRGETDYILPEENKYGFSLTIKDNTLLASAGIDWSNGNGYYILLPDNPYQVAKEIREYLINRFQLNEIGVIITDSRSAPLRRGTVGIAIAHSGFKALKDYSGDVDLFGKNLGTDEANVRDPLAAAAALLMGEASEQTPLAVIEDVPNIEFGNYPDDDELKKLHIKIEDDLYAALLKDFVPVDK